jgi:hypothetical protein
MSFRTAGESRLKVIAPFAIPLVRTSGAADAVPPTIAVNATSAETTAYVVRIWDLTPVR